MSDVKKKVLEIDTGNSQKNLKDLKQEIKDLRSQLLGLDEASEEYAQTSIELGNKLHELVEVQEAAKYATADIGQTISSMGNLMSAATSSIAAMTGTLSLLGVDASKTADEVTKVITTFMAIAQASASIDTATKAYSGLNKRLIAFIATKKAEKKATTDTAKAEVADTTAKVADTVATKGAEKAQRGFNAAIKANPLGAMLAVITAVVAGIALLVKALKSIANAKADREIAKVSSEMKKYNSEMATAISNNDFFADLAEAAGKSAKEVRQMRYDNANEELKMAQNQMDRMYDRLYSEKNGKNRKKVVEYLQGEYDKLVEAEQSAYDKLDSIRKANYLAETRENTENAKKRREEYKKAQEDRKNALEQQRKDEEQANKDIATSKENLKKSDEELTKSRLDEGKKIQYQINLYQKLLEKQNDELSKLKEGTTEWNNKKTEINNTTKALEEQLVALDDYNSKSIKSELDKESSKETNDYTSKSNDIENSEFATESARLEAEYQLEVEHTNKLKELYERYRANDLISQEEYDANMIDLNQNLKEREIEIARQKKDERIALEQATYSAIESISGSLTSILSGIADNYEESTEQYKGLKIAETIISGASAIVKTWNGYAEMGVAGTIAAAAQTAALATTTALQIAKIKKVKTDGTETGSGSTETRYSIGNSVMSSVSSDYTASQLQMIADNTDNISDTRCYILLNDIQEALNANKVKVQSNTF